MSGRRATRSAGRAVLRRVGPRAGQPRPGTADDVLAITRLLGLHLQAITHDSPALMAATFERGGELRLPWASIRGRRRIERYLAAHRRGVGAGNREFHANLVVDVQGDRAIATHTTMVIAAGRAPPQVFASATCTNALRRDPRQGWLIEWQVIEPDPSYDAAVGMLGDVVQRLAARVGQLEREIAVRRSR